MNRLKTFFMYFLILLAFFIVSNVLENGLIEQMYKDMTGTIDDTYIQDGQLIDLDITVNEAKSTRRNGYINLTVKNNSNTYISEAYVKVELYSKSNVLAITKYMEISGLSSGEERNYKLKFNGSYIETYNMNFENEYPDKEYIINVFGYDINTTNIFGMDLSEYINAENFSSFGSSTYTLIVNLLNDLPWGRMFLFYLVFLCVL